VRKIHTVSQPYQTIQFRARKTVERQKGPEERLGNTDRETLMTRAWEIERWERGGALERWGVEHAQNAYFLMLF